jgi:hypothetical protein
VIGFGLLGLIVLGFAITLVGRARLYGERATQENERRPRTMSADPTLPDWFRNMDKNADSKLSRSEFLGTDKQFRRFDTDKDGFISPDKARAADAEFRNQVPE